MKVYIEAYDNSGVQILGNLDGQGVHECKDIRKRQWFKSLSEFKSLNDRVSFYWVVSEGGERLATVLNRHNPLHRDKKQFYSF